MSVTLIIKKAPDISLLTQVATYTPRKSTVASPVMRVTTPVPQKSPAMPTPSERATIIQSAPDIFCYVRNNRIVGNFNSAAEAQIAMDFRAQRENELGADI